MGIQEELKRLQALKDGARAQAVQQIPMKTGRETLQGGMTAKPLGWAAQPQMLPTPVPTAAASAPQGAAQLRDVRVRKAYEASQQRDAWEEKAQANRKAIAQIRLGGRLDQIGRKEVDKLTQEIDALRTAQRRSREQQNIFELSQHREADDFEKQASIGNTRADSTINKKVNVAPHAERHFELMQDDERALYHYLLQVQGKEKAKTYLDSMQETLNSRKGQKEAQYLDKLDGFERFRDTALHGIGVGFDQYGRGLQGFLTNKALPVSSSQFAAQQVREDLADIGPKFLGSSLAQMAYDLDIAGANMLPSIGLSALAPGLGAPAALAQGLGLGSMGVSAAGQGYQSALREGHDPASARLYGTARGISEAGMQKALGGFGSLGGASGRIATATQGIQNTALRGAANVAGKMGAEGLEEGLQEVIDPVLRTGALGVDFQPAKAQNVAYAASLGALMGGGFAGLGALRSGGARVPSGQDVEGAQAAAADTVPNASPAPSAPLALPPSRFFVSPEGEISVNEPVKAEARDMPVRPYIEQTGQRTIAEDDPFKRAGLQDEQVQEVEGLLRMARQAGQTPTAFLSAISAPAHKAVDETVAALSAELVQYKGQGVSIAQESGVRLSNNEQWYSDFYKKNGRAPNKSERAAIARELVMDDVSKGRGQYVEPKLAENYRNSIYFADMLDKIGEDAVHVANVNGETQVTSGRIRADAVPQYSPVAGRQVAGEFDARRSGLDLQSSGAKAQRARFTQQIDAALRGEIDPHTPIVIGETPSILQQHGANNLKMTLNQSDIFKMAYPEGYMGGKHNLGFYAIKNLPDQIENPVAILKSATQKNSLVVFTEFLDADGRPVMIPIHLDKNARLGISNEVASMYGRKSFDLFIRKQRELGNIIYENKNKDLQSLPSSGLQLPRAVSDADPMLQSIPRADGNIKRDQTHMSGGFGSNTVGAAQSSTKYQSKTSKFRENTLENTPQLSDEAREALPEEDFSYDVISERQSLREASERLSVDFDGEVRDLTNKESFDGADTDTAMGILEHYGEAISDGTQESRKQLHDWAQTVASRMTQMGQGIQALAKYTREPSGMVLQAQSTVESTERKLFDERPKLKNAVENGLRDTEKAVKDAQGEAVKQTAKAAETLLPEELLARKIAADTKASAPKLDPTKDMVNELYRLAQESPILKQAQVQRSPTEFLRHAVHNKAQYVDTWNKAKAILSERFAQDSAALAVLSDYFDKGVVPNYSQKTLRASITEAARAVGEDIGKIITRNSKDKAALLAGINQYLTKEIGVDGAQAAALTEQISDTYYTMLQEKASMKLDAMFRDRPKSMPKSLKQKVMDLIALGAYSRNDIRDLIKAQNKMPVLTAQEAADVFSYVQKAEEFAQDSYEHRMYMAKADAIIANKVPAEFRERFRGTQRQLMLLNPKTTLTRNPLGNIILGTVENTKDIVGTLLDMALSTQTGERTTTVHPKILLEQAKGFGVGLVEWYKDIKNGVDTSPSRGQIELPNKRIFENKVQHFLDQVLRHMLQLGDRPFYQAAFQGRIEELKRIGIVGEEAKVQARLYALERVFQNDSTLSKTAGKVRDAFGIPGDLITPYTQTPANVMDKLIDYSPAGAAKMIAQGVNAHKTGKFDQKLLVDRAARMLTGGAIIAIGWAMAKALLMTADLDKDKDVRAAQYAAGMLPYAIKTAESYYTYDWAQPIGGLLSVGAAAYFAGEDEESFSSKLIAGAKAGVNTVFSQQFLQGVFRMMSGYNPAEGLFNAFLGTTSQATPSVFAALTRTMDPYKRETYDVNKFTEQGNKLKARIPWLSGTLPKKLDSLGQPVMQSQGRDAKSRALENFLSPGQFSTLVKGKVYDEAFRLHEATGDAGVFPSAASKKINIGAETKVLSAKEYGTYASEKGKRINSLVRALIDSPAYQKMGNDERIKTLKDVYAYADERAKALVSKFTLSDTMSTARKADDFGIPVSDYFALRTNMKEASTAEKFSIIDESKLKPDQKAYMMALQEKSFAEKYSKVDANGIDTYAYFTYVKNADADGNGSVKQSEAKMALDKTKLSRAQKAYLFALQNEKWKARPYR